MNNINPTNEQKLDDEMLDEYDFSQGIRGKHYQSYREGHSVTIYKDNVPISIENYTLEDGTIILDPDLREYFPDSESVNSTLRNLINLIPKKISNI
jgi:hypothetical protein